MLAQSVLYLEGFILRVDLRCYNLTGIGGFRDTYLGRQVVSRPGGPRAGMGSAGDLGEHCEKSNLLF